MFAHQVMEDLNILKERGLSWCKDLEDGIRSSQKFHLGQSEDVLKCAIKDRVGLFSGTLGDISLPYPICWMDYIRTVGNMKIGALLVNREYDGMPGFDVFGFFRIGINPPWIPSRIFAQVKVVKDPVFNVSSNNISFCYFKDGEKLENVPNGIFEGYYKLLSIINVALIILSCKNITTETHDPPAKLNKARQKRGKQPLFTYHTLVLKPVGKKQESIPKHLWNNRIHLQRGHFKTYTKEAPLFGHITGRFWWQPHVRGQNREGVVMKDYKVEAS